MPPLTWKENIELNHPLNVPGKINASTPWKEKIDLRQKKKRTSSIISPDIMDFFYSERLPALSQNDNTYMPRIKYKKRFKKSHWYKRTHSYTDASVFYVFFVFFFFVFLFFFVLFFFFVTRRRRSGDSRLNHDPVRLDQRRIKCIIYVLGLDLCVYVRPKTFARNSLLHLL